MKLMVVPSDRITDHTVTRLDTAIYVAKAVATGRMHQARQFLKQQFCWEAQWCGDLPIALGRENTFIVGRYHPGYTAKYVPANSWCPSMHALPLGTHVSAREAMSLVGSMDAVLIGARSSDVGTAIRKAALAKNIFVAVIDFYDHESMFADRDLTAVSHKLKPGKDFNLYFKESLPKGMRQDWLLPLSPCPIRIENFPSERLPFQRKNIPVFYRGALQDKKRRDRTELAQILCESITGAVIQNTRELGERPISDYWDYFSRARIAFTPAGKVWDTSRHAESAAFGCVPLISLPDMETAVEDFIHDGENAIVYQTYTDEAGDLRIFDPESVIRRIRDVLADEPTWSRLATNWREEILARHTTLHRAQYISEQISSRL